MTYTSYAALAAEQTEGVDYARTVSPVAGSPWCVIAIHGGGIEAGTGEMCRAVAGSDVAWYEFAGIKSSGNSALHITSTLFDEPLCLALVTTSARALSLHGYTGAEGVAETIVGGRDVDAAIRVAAALEAAGFAVVLGPEGLDGDDPENVANRGWAGAGVQLEVSRAQRAEWFPGGDLSRAVRESGVRTDACVRYAVAVGSAMRWQAPDLAAAYVLLAAPTVRGLLVDAAREGAELAGDT